MRGDSPREQPPLTPDEVGARVSAILAQAERDAREIIEGAQRDADRERAQLLEREDTLGLGALTRAVESLTVRVSSLERAIDARLEVLWRALTPPEPGAAVATGAVATGAVASTAVARAERLHAVDLALRGFSRAQIAAELRSMMAESQIEQLLDDVLERA